MPMLTTIATHSSCSARRAARQVHTTRPRPNTAASRQTSPKAAPTLPSLVSGAPTAPNRVRTSSQVTADVMRAIDRIGESRALGAAIEYAPRCCIAVRSSDSSGTDAAAATTSAASPERSLRAASAR